MMATRARTMRPYQLKGRRPTTSTTTVIASPVMIHHCCDLPAHAAGKSKPAGAAGELPAAAGAPGTTTAVSPALPPPAAPLSAIPPRARSPAPACSHPPPPPPTLPCATQARAARAIRDATCNPSTARAPPANCTARSPARKASVRSAQRRKRALLCCLLAGVDARVTGSQLSGEGECGDALLRLLPPRSDSTACSHGPCRDPRLHRARRARRRGCVVTPRRPRGVERVG